MMVIEFNCNVSRCYLGRAAERRKLCGRGGGLYHLACIHFSYHLNYSINCTAHDNKIPKRPIAAAVKPSQEAGPEECRAGKRKCE
jgi:hypothetical protein